MTRRYTVGVIAGDGIGPELVGAARTVLDAVLDRDPELVVDLVDVDAGADTYRRTGQNIAPRDLDRVLHEFDATLKGPVGLPDVRRPDGTEGGLLGGTLRNGFDAYANIRPFRSFPGGPSPFAADHAPIDAVIVRENTEGLYLSRGLGVGNERAVTDQLLLTREGVERVVHAAFRLARTRDGAPADSVRRVTCVDKSNVLRSYAFFRAAFDRVAAEYPDIEADHRYADAAGHDLVAAPERFDVLVMENLLGDVLSDVGAATVGGLGMCPSGNVGDAGAYFEPVHGSAPTIAGRDLANPISQILSTAMLLRHLGEDAAASAVDSAVAAVLSSGEVVITPAGSPVCGTAAVGGLVAAAVGDRVAAARRPRKPVDSTDPED